MRLIGISAHVTIFLLFAGIVGCRRSPSRLTAKVLVDKSPLLADTFRRQASGVQRRFSCDVPEVIIFMRSLA